MLFPSHDRRWLGTVLGDLAEIGYDAEWCVLGGYDIGGAIQRNRIWILAYENAGTDKKLRVKTKRDVINKTSEKLQFRSSDTFSALLDDAKSRVPINTGDERVVNDVPGWVDRFKAVGNAQIPTVAAVAFMTLHSRVCNNA